MVGFEPIYVACALLPVLAGFILLVGVRYETGQFLPDVDLEVAGGEGPADHAD